MRRSINCNSRCDGCSATAGCYRFPVGLDLVLSPPSRPPAFPAAAAAAGTGRHMTNGSGSTMNVLIKARYPSTRSGMAASGRCELASATDASSCDGGREPREPGRVNVRDAGRDACREPERDSDAACEGCRDSGARDGAADGSREGGAACEAWRDSGALGNASACVVLLVAPFDASAVEEAGTLSFGRPGASVLHDVPSSEFGRRACSKNRRRQCQ
mmetsp:Transcript_40933/g.122196  ORF Transcript_40933/g.122196 Transcript_40933/m.122196 type:complete len:216 (-) Transcript_40933:5069-5716(-)